MTTTTIYSPSMMNPSTFGLLGDFEGDPALWSEIQWCQQAYASTSHSKPPLQRLVALLDQLPHAGRQAVVRLVLGTSPQRDALLRDLWEYCFLSSASDDDKNYDNDTEDKNHSTDGEEDFVLIAYPPRAVASKDDSAMSVDGPELSPALPKPLYLPKFHIFQAVQLLLPFCSAEVGVTTCRHYLEGVASTRYRAKMLQLAALTFSQKDRLSDQQLYQYYQESPQSVQRNLIKAVCHKGRSKRQGFLRLIYEQDILPQLDDPSNNGIYQDFDWSLLYHLDSDYLATQWSRLFEPRWSTNDSSSSSYSMPFPMAHWGKHGDRLWLPQLEKLLKSRSKDSLAMGKLWMALLEQSADKIDDKSLQSRHVLALLKLLEKFHVYTIRPGAKYISQLEKMSANGPDVTNFEDVERIVMVPRWMLDRLSQKDRLALACHYVKERDVIRFEAIYSKSIPLHELPYQSYFDQINFESFWKARLPNASRIHAILDDTFQSPRNALAIPLAGGARMEYLKAWTTMHYRFLHPSGNHEESKKLEGDWARVLEAGGRSWKSRDFWNPWYDSHNLFWTRDSGTVVKQVMKQLAEECNSYPALSPKIKTFATFVQEVLIMAEKALDQVYGHVSVSSALDPLVSLLNVLSFQTLAKSNLQDVQNLSDLCVRLLYEKVIPYLDKSLQFDLEPNETYIDRPKLDSFEKKIRSILAQWAHSSKVLNKLASTFMQVHTRASIQSVDGKNKSFTVVVGPSPAKKLKFVSFDEAQHERAKQICVAITKDIMRSNRKSLLSPENSKQLWHLVRSIPIEWDPKEYLRCSSLYCPKEWIEEEHSTISKYATEIILTTFKKSPTSWESDLDSIAKDLFSLNLLETVLGNEDIPPKVATALLAKHGGFANEISRQALKDETFVADAEARVKGLTSWLDAACKTGSGKHLSNALSFAASRIRNESGIHRRTIFNWIETNFVSNVVQASFRSVGDKLILDKKICSTILDIQTNDLSRMDSVGQHVCFNRLPEKIFSFVLQFDPTQLFLEKRQLWFDCAMQMDWNCKAASGEEGLACYAWPCSRSVQLKSSSWITQETIETAYPPSASSTTAKLGRFLKVAKNQCHFRALKKEDLFGPVQCIPMLETSLNAVWSEDLPSPSVRIADNFPQDDKVSKAWLERMLVLYRLAGDNWQEVELLTLTLDRIIAPLKNAITASDRDFQRAHTLLHELFRGSKHSVFMNRRLSDGCDKLFRSAVASNRHHYVKKWLERWSKLYMSTERRAWNSYLDDRTTMFLDNYAEGCEPDAWRPVLSKSERILLECQMAKELLSMSPSALVLSNVRNVLFTKRQDILLKYVRQNTSTCGVFRDTNPADHVGSDSKYESIHELLFHCADEETLLSCHAHVSIQYSKYARLEAINNKVDLKSKTQAIRKFMSAPSTQHNDVLEALQSSLDDVVRESLINNVFNLDSPWHILGYLLSQKAIEKNDQRVTSTLLRFVSKHVHVDKVVEVVRLLLKPPRREKLTFQLHKAVVRMLFDAKTLDSVKILQQEWKTEGLPETIKTLIAQNCMECVASGKIDGWEMRVLSDIATGVSFTHELKFVLLEAYVGNSFIFDILEPHGVEKDEVLELLREINCSCLVSVTSPLVAKEVRSILKQLEEAPPLPFVEGGINDTNGTLPAVAQLTRLSLSDVFLPGHEFSQEKDLTILDEISSLLSNALHSFTTTEQSPNHTRQFEIFTAASLHAKASRIILKYVVEKENLANPHNSVARDALAKLLQENIVARNVRSILRVFLDFALNTPLRKHIQRTAVLRTLQNMINEWQELPFVQKLVYQPFRDEWKIVSNDVTNLQNCSYCVEPFLNEWDDDGANIEDQW